MASRLIPLAKATPMTAPVLRENEVLASALLVFRIIEEELLLVGRSTTPESDEGMQEEDVVGVAVSEAELKSMEMPGVCLFVVCKGVVRVVNVALEELEVDEAELVRENLVVDRVEPKIQVNEVVLAEVDELKDTVALVDSEVRIRVYEVELYAEGKVTVIPTCVDTFVDDAEHVV